MGELSAIQNHINRYTLAVNRRSFSEIEHLFTAYGSWELVGVAGMKFSGPSDIAEGIEAMIEPNPFLMQINAPAVIEVEGDTATAQSSVKESGSLPGDKPFESYGIYEDQLVRVEGRWLFKSRSFKVIKLRGIG